MAELKQWNRESDVTSATWPVGQDGTATPSSLMKSDAQGTPVPTMEATCRTYFDTDWPAISALTWRITCGVTAPSRVFVLAKPTKRKLGCPASRRVANPEAAQEAKRLRDESRAPLVSQVLVGVHVDDLASCLLVTE